MPRRIFLLSPANSSGRRAKMLQRPDGEGDLATRLRNGSGASLGEVFSFVSSLYFRGKLAYARAFARPEDVYVITPADGLRSPDSVVRVHDLRRYAKVPVDSEEKRYRDPLLRDIRRLAPEWGETDVVLLGSIASAKYTGLLTSVLGVRLVFPSDFVGRGDMSRGGLMLRSAAEGKELTYVAVVGAERRGARPPRLPPLPRAAAGTRRKKG